MRALALAIVAATALVTPAQAATTIRTFNYTGTNIERLFGAGPSPVSTVILSFTLEFDPLLAYTNQTSGLVLNSLNLPLGSPLGFSYNPGPGQFMTVGGLAGGTNSASTANNDFILSIITSTPGASPTAQFAFTIAGAQGGLYRANNHSLSVRSVPEPASWVLMIAGFGLAGAAIRRRSAELRKLPITGAGAQTPERA